MSLLYYIVLYCIIFHYCTVAGKNAWCDRIRFSFRVAGMAVACILRVASYKRGNQRRIDRFRMYLIKMLRHDIFSYFTYQCLVVVSSFSLSVYTVRIEHVL